MTRLVAILFAGLLQSSFAATQPNIVLFLIDDLGWKDVGCYGSEYYKTPNIDRLAAQGVRFTNGYAACAVCSPTRAAVQTGRYPARLGVTDWIRSRFQGGRISAGFVLLVRPRTTFTIVFADFNDFEKNFTHSRSA